MFKWFRKVSQNSVLTDEQESALADAFSRFDAAAVEKIINQIDSTQGTPFQYGNKAIAQLRIDYKGKNATLLEHVFTWPTPFSEHQTELCNVLFNALGEHLLSENLLNDPLLLACKDNNLDIVKLLIPIYTQNQEIMASNSNNITSDKIENMVKRISDAIEQTTSHEILDLIQGKCDKNLKIYKNKAPANIGAMSPGLGKLRDKKSNQTYSDLINEQIEIQRSVINNTNYMPNNAGENNNQTLQNNMNSSSTRYLNRNTGMKMAQLIGTVLLFSFISTAFLVEHCTKEYSNKTFDASKMFNKMAEWLWVNLCQQEPKSDMHPHHDNTPTAAILTMSTLLLGVVVSGIGAAIGSKCSKPRR